MINIVDFQPVRSVTADRFDEDLSDHLRLPGIIPESPKPDFTHIYIARLARSFSPRDYAGDYRVGIARKGELRQRLVWGGFRLCAEVALVPVSPVGEPLTRKPDNRLIDTEGMIYGHGIRLCEGYVYSRSATASPQADTPVVARQLGVHDPTPKPYEIYC